MDFEPLTAREALLAIRARRSFGVDPELERLIDAGLSRTGMENFELTDQLADRLADAHKLLRDIDIEGDKWAPLARDILILPPDLETIIERRLGPGERHEKKLYQQASLSLSIEDLEALIPTENGDPNRLSAIHNQMRNALRMLRHDAGIVEDG